MPAPTSAGTRDTSFPLVELKDLRPNQNFSIFCLVLRVHLGEMRVRPDVLYVTDFTPNPKLPNPRAKWDKTTYLLSPVNDFEILSAGAMYWRHTLEEIQKFSPTLEGQVTLAMAERATVTWRPTPPESFYRMEQFYNNFALVRLTGRSKMFGALLEAKVERFGVRLIDFDEDAGPQLDAFMARVRERVPLAFWRKNIATSIPERFHLNYDVASSGAPPGPPPATIGDIAQTSRDDFLNSLGDYEIDGDRVGGRDQGCRGRVTHREDNAERDSRDNGTIGDARDRWEPHSVSAGDHHPASGPTANAVGELAGDAPNGAQCRVQGYFLGVPFTSWSQLCGRTYRHSPRGVCCPGAYTLRDLELYFADSPHTAPVRVVVPRDRVLQFMRADSKDQLACFIGRFDHLSTPRRGQPHVLELCRENLGRVPSWVLTNLTVRDLYATDIGEMSGPGAT